MLADAPAGQKHGGAQSSRVWTALGLISAEYAWPANLGASAIAEVWRRRFCEMREVDN